MKTKRNHCHGHTPQAEKGHKPQTQKELKRPTLAWNEIQFVTDIHVNINVHKHNHTHNGDIDEILDYDFLDTDMDNLK